MQFEFATASKIIFGPGRLNTIGDLVGSFGKRVLVISGAPIEITNRLLILLESQQGTRQVVIVNHEPTLDSVREVVELARRINPELIIGIGGGSALDMAKATSAMLTNPGDVTDYLEVIGQNKRIQQPCLPLITIPTTSGTGSEVTRNAVIGSPMHHVKVSLRSPLMLPRVALIDPELTLSVPPSITAATGLDTLTQLIEPFTCNNPNPLIAALCLEGIQRVAQSLMHAYEDGSDLQAREDMSLAALFSGLALANARLGAVHGLAGAIGGEINAQHGAICAALLPNVMQVNLTALRNRAPVHQPLERYATIGELLSKDAAIAENGIYWVRSFCMHTRIKPLSAFGLGEQQFDEIIAKALKSSSMQGNPITLNPAELRTILQMSL